MASGVLVEKIFAVRSLGFLMSVIASIINVKSCYNTLHSMVNMCRKNYLFLFFLFILKSFLGFTQEIPSKIDKKDLSDFITALSSLPFGGRGVDDDGQIKAQEFIVNRYKELQLEPFSSDGFLEKFSLLQTNRGGLYIETQNHQTLRNFDGMIFTGAIHHNSTITREIIFGGYATEEALNQMEVENRFVLVVLKNQKDESNIKKNLEERKASGLFVVHADDKEFETMKRRLKDFHLTKRYSFADPDSGFMITESGMGETTDAFPNINTIYISGAAVKNIFGLPKNKLVNLANSRKMKDVPTSVVNIHFEGFKKMIETANVIGVIKGESDTAIVVSAHYDHMGKEDNHYYPGADDNASGVAALLELAEEFAQYKNLRYTMIFLATTAEEAGLLGSFYHTGRPDFNPEKIVCNINIDMISRCDSHHTDCTYLYCLGSNPSDLLDSLVRKADELFTPCACDYAETTFGIFERTDGYNFKRKGIPSILFFAGFHDDYHQPTDTIEKINFDILENRIKLICEVIRLVQFDFLSRH